MTKPCKTDWIYCSVCGSKTCNIFILTQYVALKEDQYPKATALLCATPYPRKLIVLSKYCFCLIIYAVCCLIYGIDTLIFPKLGTFNVKMAVILNPGRANVFPYGDNATVWTDYNDDGRIIRVGLEEGWVQEGADSRKASHTIVGSSQNE